MLTCYLLSPTHSDIIWPFSNLKHRHRKYWVTGVCMFTQQSFREVKQEEGTVVKYTELILGSNTSCVALSKSLTSWSFSFFISKIGIMQDTLMYRAQHSVQHEGCVWSCIIVVKNGVSSWVEISTQVLITWASYLTSQCLCSFICKMRIIIVPIV